MCYNTDILAKNMSNETKITPIATALISLGLGQNEAILYETLLRHPGATIPLLQKESSLSRTMLYYVLDSLQSYGLVHPGKADKKTIYIPQPPEKLEDMLKDQENELNRQKQALKGVISDLSSVWRLSTNKPGVRFFEGAKWLNEVMWDSLNTDTEIYTFIDAEAVEKFYKEENKNYVAKRRAKGIKKKIIALDCDFARKHYANFNSDITEARLLPKGARPPFQTATQIYSNSVSFITLTTKALIGIILQEENIANFFKTMFEFAWQHSLPIPATKPPSAPTNPLMPRRDPNAPLVALNQ